MCLRIWYGFTKLLRNNVNKDRVIDSLFFGSFYKKNNEYVFVSDGKGNGTFADFKLLTNS